ncbi:MAG: outer membrane protein assembly factor BamD [Bacteroidales bacterium]|nr:outer membrane protein assembly factor BamD [Bacteroidales bacterium]
MKFSRFILVAAALVMMLPACKSQYEQLLSGNDVEAKYKAAFELFNQGKYRKAADMFESMSILVNGTPQDDTVQFYWALSNYRFKDYYTAEANFKSFVDKFPRSPFSENAEFLRLDCLYKSTYRWELDQTPTYAAIVAINEYKMKYPASLHGAVCTRMLEDLNERLDKKAYENAYIYYKMEDYKAARVAFRNVLKEDSDNIYREDILFYTAMSSYKYAFLSVPQKQKERYMVFVDDYLNFVGEYPDSPRCKNLENLYKKAKAKI